MPRRSLPKPSDFGLFDQAVDIPQVDEDAAVEFDGVQPTTPDQPPDADDGEAQDGCRVAEADETPVGAGLLVRRSGRPRRRLTRVGGAVVIGHDSGVAKPFAADVDLAILDDVGDPAPGWVVSEDACRAPRDVLPDPDRGEGAEAPRVREQGVKMRDTALLHLEAADPHNRAPDPGATLALEPDDPLGKAPDRLLRVHAISGEGEVRDEGPRVAAEKILPPLGHWLGWAPSATGRATTSSGVFCMFKVLKCSRFFFRMFIQLSLLVTARLGADILTRHTPHGRVQA